LTVKPTSNGQGAVPVKTKKERPLKKYRAAKERSGGRENENTACYIRCFPPCFVKTGLFSVYTSLEGCFFQKRRERKARDRIKNQT